MRAISLNFYVIICCAVLTSFTAAAQTVEAQNYSSLVYPGIDGKLVYLPDEKGNIIPDFSHAGYKNSGVSIPFVPVKEILWPVEGDDSPNIQSAIDRVSNLPSDEYGFRGAVLLKMGYYELASPLRISASGVVLRGEGQGETGTILIGLGRFDGGYDNRQTANLIVISGETCWDEVKGSSQRIIDDYIPVGAHSFRVENTKAFRVGDM
ncbi:MAG: peptidoglycan-binding protein, partial [Candidatus Latescibacteria bacterium]|nr:peptidoglycan-binding protein [Candidatus Latescibacterota bacterium]